jgi:hypothetical protein
VYYWRKTGSGPRGVKIGKCVLYAVGEIQRYDRELLAADARRVSQRAGLPLAPAAPASPGLFLAAVPFRSVPVLSDNDLRHSMTRYLAS